MNETKEKDRSGGEAAMEDAPQDAALKDAAPNDTAPRKSKRASSPSARLRKQAPKAIAEKEADSTEPAPRKRAQRRSTKPETGAGTAPDRPSAKKASAAGDKTRTKAKRRRKAKPARKASKKLEDKKSPPRLGRFSLGLGKSAILTAERGLPDDEEDTGRLPVPDLVEVTGNPIPDGCISNVIETPGGIRLRAALWPLPHGRAKGTVCVFQGRTESIEKYFETVDDLRARGFWVATFDWRGQGGSDRLLSNPLKGHVNGFGGYREDLNLFMQDVVLPDCPPPYFGLAHSMGGLVLLRTASFRANWFERIVACAPLVALPDDNRLASIAVPAAQIASRVGLSRVALPTKGLDELPPFTDNPLTSDAQRYSRWGAILEAEPRLRVGTPTFGWLAAVGDAMDFINSDHFPTQVQVPVLMVSAGLDRVVSSRAIESLGKRLRIGGHISVNASRHEILQERDDIRQQFLAAFDEFIPGTGR